MRVQLILVLVLAFLSRGMLLHHTGAVQDCQLCQQIQSAPSDEAPPAPDPEPLLGQGMAVPLAVCELPGTCSYRLPISRSPPPA